MRRRVIGPQTEVALGIEDNSKKHESRSERIPRSSSTIRHAHGGERRRTTEWFDPECLTTEGLAEVLLRG